VTINYPNGTVLKALVLSQDENDIRAIAPGGGDALAFTRIQGTWISEGLEPVIIEFEWQRRVAVPVPAVDDCICPKQLAVRLISALLSGDNTVEADEGMPCVPNPQGAGVAIPRTELRLG
jgi:hypothetical protein